MHQATYSAMPASMRRRPPEHFSSRGIAIVEVLIAIVVFAFGMLALAGLQVAALKYQKSAWSRSGAAMLTTDIAERMRANMPGVLAGNYSLAGSYATLSARPPAPSDCNPRTATCTAAQMAQNDIAAWSRLAGTEMPVGAATLAGDMTIGFIVTVMWNDKNMRRGDGSLETSTQCPAVVTQNCCPTGTPAGVRCINSVVRP